MSTYKEQYTDNTIQETIRECFFLKPDITVTPEMILSFKEGAAAGNFQQLSLHTNHCHQDQFSIHISHDIDWLDPHHPYAIINSLRSKISKHSWFSLKQLRQKDLFLRNIEQLLLLEKELTIDAIYCIGAATGTQLGRYDLRYAVWNTLYGDLIDLLSSYKQSIGLHASCSADKTGQLKREISTLKQYVPGPVTIQRSHYLKHTAPGFYNLLVQNGFRYDLGYGQAGKIGLRNHFPGKFKPFYPASYQPVNLTLIPLILLDNVFFRMSYHTVISQFRQTLQLMKQYNGSGCILFHPENMLLKPQLYSYFEEIVHICKEEGALLNPPLT